MIRTWSRTATSRPTTGPPSIGSSPTSATSPPTAAGTGDVAEGGELFRLQCAACHTSTGDGGALLRREAPSLHDADERETAEAIRVGPGQMPAFGDAAMTDAQVASVVAYVKYLDHPRDRGGQALLHLGPVAEGGLALVAVFVMLLFARWIGERG